MGFLDKAKAAAEQAAAKTKEGVADVQTKRDLGKAYTELGEKAYELSSSGAISHPEIDAIVARIDTLKEQAEREPAMAGATAGTSTASTEPPPSDAPPAMPS
jgi:hypothetical protein